MPSVRINPRDGSHLSYRQVQSKWMDERKQLRRAAKALSAADNKATPPSESPAPESLSLSSNLLQSSSSASTAGFVSTALVHRENASRRPETDAPSGVAAQTEGIELSPDQQRIFREVKQGRNVFFTGPAGTGKSVLLREIISWAKEYYTETQVAITALTGIAGVNIGGSTLHSFAGIGLGKEPPDTLAARILESTRPKRRWRETRMLIIDEISMMDGSLFDKLDHIARVVRGNSHPFGGIQLVLSGDFFQLPPVPDQSHNYKQVVTFAFDAYQWSKCIDRPMFLQQVFRQTDDTFIDLLSSIRMGKMTARHINILRSLERPIHYQDGIGPTRLYPRKAEVEEFNNRQLEELPGPEFQYHSTDSGGYDPYGVLVPENGVRALLDRMIALANVTLKIGAQVMLIQNVIQGKLVNGSTGVVVEFLTIHEALDRHIIIAELNDRKVNHNRKAPEQRSKEEKFHDIVEKLEHEGTYRLRQISDNMFSHKQYWPLVRFTNGLELLCAPLAFTVQGFTGNTEAHRLQVPLILAWALSIHKSQGQTLDRVKVDLGQVFENGQAYVALSRARSMEGLEIENFEPSKITVDPRVVAWQSFYSGFGYDDDIMDSEEAMRSFWEQE